MSDEITDRPYCKDFRPDAQGYCTSCHHIGHTADTEDRAADWFCTATGRKVHLLSPEPSDICIEDVAHALSHICRFGGHSLVFYSVAQHSVHVSELSVLGDRHSRNTSYAKAALLHDAAEAYLGDVIRPLKRLLGSSYGRLERLWNAVIGEALGFDPFQLDHPVIKRCDQIALATERRDLCSPRLAEYRDMHKDAELFGNTDAIQLQALDADSARRLFLERWDWVR